MYLDRIEQPHDGTNQGLLEHPIFRQWAAADTGILILTAHPGSGKTVIAKHMVEELPRWRNTHVSSFFFKDNNTGQNKPTVALCNVLSELFRHSRHLVDKIEDDLERIDKDRLRSSVKALWSILEKSSHDIAPGSITVVLDAMDECDPRQGQELLRILDQYFNQADHRIKLLLTTRPLESVLDIFFWEAYHQPRRRSPMRRFSRKGHRGRHQ
jgi:Cdc6-like AAA superfamily ATPase